MRYPKVLQKHGTIGCIAPSFGCSIEPYHSAFHHAIEVWQEMGYQVKLGPNCYLGSGVGISNTPSACGDEVNRFFTQEDCDVVISCGGGELMCEVVSHIDFAAIAKAEPKWFMGFSDNTNLTFLLPVLTDTASIYGPCAPSFGMEPWHPVLRDAWGILTGGQNRVSGYPLWEKESRKDEEHPLEPYHVTEPKHLVVYPGIDRTKEDSRESAAATDISRETLPREGIAMRGRLLGGCLDCLDTLVGTRFDRVGEFCEKYRQDGILWFIESCDLNPMGIRRALWQLQEAGWFRYVKGFLIGRPLCFGEQMLGLDQYHAVYDILKEYQVPVIMDVDLGHLPPSMPIVCGAVGMVEVKDNGKGAEIFITYEMEQ